MVSGKGGWNKRGMIDLSRKREKLQMWPNSAGVKKKESEDKDTKPVNWYGLAMKPEVTDVIGDNDEFISPVVIVANNAGKVVKEVKENINKLVTNVV